MARSLEQRISLIAPLLRGCAAQINTLPLVRYLGDTPATDQAALSIELSSHEDAPCIIKELSKALAQSKQAVTRINIADLGSFALTHGSDNPPGRVADKVAIVTGAAQGFGLEIAQSLAAQGAYVVLADINIQAAQEAADTLNKDAGTSRAMAVAMNVTSADSLDQALYEVIKTYGGFDIFISNAGVLKAESVKTQALKDFQFVTDVNYTGYFLCVQKAAPFLALQHQARPGYTSDIIQINSKSGLQGSNRNGAYAGSKFGSVGLTQSFAMELIEDGIKVNSVCPGNFFDGPLWSNPENGLFMQYLRTNKVPGAQTIADVRKAYEAKVPMGRGCSTADVMKAVFYLIEQQYETGQAVPVTGGQVMLH
jgi:sorbitol-6-phosphate 2-dehydrogenase